MRTDPTGSTIQLQSNLHWLAPASTGTASSTAKQHCQGRQLLICIARPRPVPVPVRTLLFLVGARIEADGREQRLSL